MALGWRELRGRAGLAQFATGYGVVVASAALFALRGRIPDVLATRPRERPPGHRRRADPRGHASLLRRSQGARDRAPRGGSRRGRLSVAHLRPAEPAARTILSNGLVAVLLAVAAWTAARHRSRGERLLDVITSVALACCAAAFGARAVLKGAAAAGIDLRDGDLSAAVATLAGTLAAVIWTMTVLTSANRRLTLEVSREKDRQMLLNRVLVISARSRDAGRDHGCRGRRHRADATAGRPSRWLSPARTALPFPRKRRGTGRRPPGPRTRASSGARTRAGLTQLVTGRRPRSGLRGLLAGASAASWRCRCGATDGRSES